MWNANYNNITMTEGDFGIFLPITIIGFEFAQGDSVKIVIKKSSDGDTILQKEYTEINNNTVNLELTLDETNLLPIGQYVYRLDIYQNGNFMCNVVPIASFKVVNKA